MRWLLELVLFFAATVAILAAIAWWFFLYSGDLPDVTRLAKFAPAANTSVSDPCLASASVAIPYESIGVNLRNALTAVDGRLPVQISRTMFCAARFRTLHRQLAETRTAARLERNYSRQQLLVIYANRTPFGEGLVGVQSASQYFFHKGPGDLDIAEAALLAGLAVAPSYYSLLRHPDRALSKRNEVIDAMAKAGYVTSSEAEGAKSAPIGIVVTAPGFRGEFAPSLQRPPSP